MASRQNLSCLTSSVCVLLLLSLVPANAFIVEVDYTYDTNNFFDTTAKRDAIQAAADRFSRVMTDNLTGVGPGGTGTGTFAGWRIGFTHPGTGNSFQVSTAASPAADPLAGAGVADVYNFAGLSADRWILYAGGRPQSAAATGGTGTGVNFTSTFTDLNGPMHRGVISETPGPTTNTAADIPAWGGAVSFNSALNWHFDTTTVPAGGTVDFYSIALHEIGHALGLSLSFNQWEQFDTGGTYTGPNAVAAYNADNGTSLTELNQVSATNEHWEDGTYDSIIYAGGDPNYVGTVGEGNLQDLLLEPIANFTPTQRRIELTNVDVAALTDLGWSVVAIPEPSAFLFFALVASVSAARRRTTRKITNV